MGRLHTTDRVAPTRRQLEKAWAQQQRPRPAGRPPTLQKINVNCSGVFDPANSPLRMYPLKHKDLKA